ncbi:MAG: hypothetical protein VX341_11015 [Bdellovibrionota bacterium]|nr:hypothetical protein [Bdellovibrionota bacterium]
MNSRKCFLFLIILISITACGVKSIPVSKNITQSIEATYQKEFQDQLKFDEKVNKEQEKKKSKKDQ